MQITDDALEAAVDLSNAHLTGSALPGKAIQVMDEAGALLHLRNGRSQPPDLAKLAAEIQQLDREKEDEVARQDFAKAASLRDRADQLKKQHEAITQEWHKSALQVIGQVDRETVAEVVQRMMPPQ